MDRVAFLFDNDGVLIDSSDLHWHSWQLLMKEEGAFFINKEMFIKSFGKRNDLILKEIAPGVAEEIRKKWAERKEELFRECAHGNISLLPGMEAFLQEIQEADIPRIIASSTPIDNLQMFISSTVLGKYFTEWMSAEEVAHGKPAPDIFIAAAKRLGFKPSECIAVEDAPAGLKSAKAAGCFVVALETSHTREELPCFDLVYSSPQALDLQEILHRFNVWKNDHTM